MNLQIWMQRSVSYLIFTWLYNYLNLQKIKILYKICSSYYWLFSPYCLIVLTKSLKLRPSNEFSDFEMIGWKFEAIGFMHNFSNSFRRMWTEEVNIHFWPGPEPPPPHVNHQHTTKILQKLNFRTFTGCFFGKGPPGRPPSQKGPKI